MSVRVSASGSPKAPGGSRPTGTLKLHITTPTNDGLGVDPPPSTKRAAFYVDGFNLFHALDDYKRDGETESFLKWLDLRRLAECLVRKGHEHVVRVVWCSAPYKFDHTKLLLHRAYKAALEAVGVTPELGHFVNEPIECRAECKREFLKPTEKAGDVNVAIHLIADGYEDVYDVAYLITNDTDQVATLKLFQDRFKEKGKSTVIVAPPGREHSQLLLDYADRHISITRQTIESCLFGKSVPVKGKPAVQRPSQYDPPNGWKRPQPSATETPPPKPIKRTRRQPKSFEVEHKPKKKVVKIPYRQ